MPQSENFEAGYPIAHHETSPGERDINTLKNSPFNEVLEAFVTEPTWEIRFSMASRANSVACLIMSKTVGFVRLGSPEEMTDATAALYSMINTEGKQEPPVGGFAHSRAVSRVEAALETLVIANDALSDGYEMNILHQDSEDRPLIEAFRFIRDNEEGVSYFELETHLESPPELEEALSDLSSAMLVSEVSIPYPAPPSYYGKPYKYVARLTPKAGLPHVSRMIDGPNRET